MGALHLGIRRWWADGKDGDESAAGAEGNQTFSAAEGIGTSVVPGEAASLLRDVRKELRVQSISRTLLT